ncbi:UNVERIFIED_CONTAM: hypothetical protein PYX00_005054 [Menopon gallinae]|uniref:Transmembrane protein 174 n=1 Tax=Menopon gallinae TaxID=328185 RepID=A0AAW2HPQ2_9NEOP
MHFWIDKRSQACGFNGRHGVPASLATGRRRRNKPMVTPVHRFQSVENGLGQHARRHHGSPQARHTNQQSSLRSTISSSTVNGSMMTATPQSNDIESNLYIETSGDGNMDTGQHSQLMRLGGLIKYGMWASFGLITVSVAITKFFISHQGMFEMLLLCTLGLLSVGLLMSCILSVCRTKNAQEFITVPPHTHRTEVEIQDVISHIEETILPVEVPASVPQQTILANLNPEPEQPPPYHIAILLPHKEQGYEDLPPPSYENAVR